MPKIKVKDENLPEEEPKEEGPEKIEKEEKADKDFKVFNKDEIFIRSYTKELHGKDAGKLAKMYAAKIGGTVK